MSGIRWATIALTGSAVVLSACTSASTTETSSAGDAYCSSSQAVVTELDSLKDMVSSGDSSRNEIADQAQVVVEAAGTAFRDSKELSAATRAEIDAADKAFRDAVKAIPSTTSSLEEAAQAYRGAYEAYDESIAAIRASAQC
jgi:hypothetical protein